jgi:DNA repair protein RadC
LSEFSLMSELGEYEKGRYDAEPLRIHELPLREQPRELVERLGFEAVGEDVLLAVILRTGTRNRNVLEVARDLIRQYGSLTDLSRVSIDELMRQEGIGKVKAQIIKSALELARRVAAETRPERPVIRTPEEAVALLRGEASNKDVEQFWVLLLDTRYRLIRPPRSLTTGILDASLIHPREVFKEAVRTSSAAVVLAHNHPSGDADPSAEDIQITRRLIDAGRIVEIDVLDHIILGQPSAQDPSGFCSMRESGLVEF